MCNSVLLRSRLSFLRAALAAACLLAWFPGAASAIIITGSFEPLMFGPLPPDGMSLTLTIDETTTRFEMTGPSDRWFAFGFDATTMSGYTLIAEGQNDSRTVNEHHISFADVGSPLVPNELNIVSQHVDEAAGLSTVVVERASLLGQPNRLDFLTSWSDLNVIWAYDSLGFGDVGYHGSQGRGFGIITFRVIPEPAASSLALAAMSAALVPARRRRAATA